jgi:hypothetical protein
MGEVLFWTLRECLLEDYTDEVDSAWTKVYSRVLITLVPSSVKFEMQSKLRQLAKIKGTYDDDLIVSAGCNKPKVTNEKNSKSPRSLPATPTRMRGGESSSLLKSSPSADAACRPPPSQRSIGELDIATMTAANKTKQHHASSTFPFNRNDNEDDDEDELLSSVAPTESVASCTPKESALSSPVPTKSSSCNFVRQARW